MLNVWAFPLHRWIECPVSKDLFQADRCAELLRAVAEPTRLRMIELLRSGPKNVGEISDALEMQVVNTSHHLGILKNAGLVTTRRDGRFIIYTLAEGVLETLKSGTKGSINLGCCKIEVPKE